MIGPRAAMPLMNDTLLFEATSVLLLWCNQNRVVALLLNLNSGAQLGSKSVELILRRFLHLHGPLLLSG